MDRCWLGRRWFGRQTLIVWTGDSGMVGRRWFGRWLRSTAWAGDEHAEGATLAGDGGTRGRQCFARQAVLVGQAVQAGSTGWAGSTGRQYWLGRQYRQAVLERSAVDGELVLPRAMSHAVCEPSLQLKLQLKLCHGLRMSLAALEVALEALGAWLAVLGAWWLCARWLLCAVYYWLL